MNPVGESIQLCLREIAAERERRAANPELARHVAQVKQFQHARFSHTYADLLADARYAKPARFFLDDLYGPTDFAQRDAQFARVVPALVRTFSKDIVATVAQLGRLHALSERLDSAMGQHLIDAANRAASAPGLDGKAYAQAWRAVGEPAAREEQIALMLDVGRALDRYTRNPLLRNSLRLMRVPAKAAGLGSLQRFLETGFDTFRAMRGADEFLATIAGRERGLAQALFVGRDVL
jgi:hypothetical protein